MLITTTTTTTFVPKEDFEDRVTGSGIIRNDHSGSCVGQDVKQKTSPCNKVGEI